MDYNELLALMKSKSADISKRTLDVPTIQNTLRADLYGNDNVTDSLRENETSKIKELYQHDQTMADRYANPASEGYMEDPYSRAKAVAQRSETTAGQLGDLQNQIAKRRDVLGSALEKAMQLLNYGLEAQKLEYSGMKDEFDNRMKLDEFNLKKSSASQSNSNALPQFMQAILGFKDKAKAIVPQSSGTAKNKAELTGIQKKYKGQTLRYTVNKDKTYSWTLDKPQQQFLTPEEVPAYEDQNATLQKLLGAFIATNPKQSDEAGAIMKLMNPQPETFGTDQGEVAAGVSGKPKTTESLKIYQDYLLNKDSGGFNIPGLNAGPAPTPAPTSQSGSGVTLMIGADGKTYQVNNDEVESAKAQGWRVK